MDNLKSVRCPRMLLRVSNITIFLFALVTLLVYFHPTLGPVPEFYEEEIRALGEQYFKQCDRKTIHKNDTDIKAALSSLKKPALFVYNRIPKCGSRSVQMVLDVLQARSHIKSVSSLVVYHQRLTEKEQSTQVKKIVKLKKPVIFDRHMWFINFTKFDYEQPIYINVVREPLERFISHYNFKRTDSLSAKKHTSKSQLKTHINDCVNKNMSECTGHKSPEGYFTRMVPFFCGQEPECRTPGPDQLAIAKRNIEKNYAVVGLSEDMKGFFYVLQKLYPKYFRGALNIYKSKERSMIRGTRTSKKKYPSPSVTEKLKQRLKYDYEIYEFVKYRFKRLKCFVTGQ